MKVRSEVLPLLLLAVAAGLVTLITSALILAWPAAAQGNDPTDLAPANLTAAVADGALTLTWEAPDVEAGSVTGYRILRRRPLQGETTLEVLLDDTGTPATAYADYSATEGGVRYVYRVVALRGDEASAHSNFVAFNLSDDLTNVGPARAPSNLAAAVEKGALTLRWDAPAQQAGSVTGYQVLRRRPLEGEKDLFLVDRDTGGDATSWVDYDATEGGARYVYRVRALRDGAVSHHSNFTVITLERDLDPQPPRDSEKQESDPPIVPLTVSTTTAISVKSTGRTTATAIVSVETADTGTVYVRLAPTGTTDYIGPFSSDTTSPGADVTVELVGLEPNVTYKAVSTPHVDFSGSNSATTVFTNRPAGEDYDSLHSSNTAPSGIWGDATTLYVGNNLPENSKVYTYNRVDQSHVSTIDLLGLTDWRASPTAPQGIWSDGTHLWVADSNYGYVEAVAFKADPPTYNADESFVFGLLGSTNNYGLWGNSSFIWVSYDDQRPSKDWILAFNKSDKQHSSDNDFLTDDDNAEPRDIWSDGSTMWVLDWTDDLAYAYVLTAGTTFGDRDQEREFDLDPANTHPRGIWSDGDTVWVSDRDGAKLYAYYLPLAAAPGPTAVSAKSTGRNTAAAVVEVTAATDATVYLRHAPSGTTDWSATLSGSPPSAGAPVDIDLTGLSPNATYDLEASLDMTFMDGTEVSGAFTNRPAGEDYNSDNLNSDNDYPSGIWGTADTLYVGQYSSTTDGKIMEYDRPDKGHASTTTLSDIVGLEDTSGVPQGLWSDGTHLWMVTDNGTAEAILLADNTHVPGQEINTAASSQTYGIWGNDSTIWIADAADDILRAHAKATRAADTTKNIAPDTDNSALTGIWSDGSTMWVLDSTDHLAYAYVLTAGTTFGSRDKDLEFAMDPENGAPWGIWSDGDTVWVSDETDGKLYAYYLPLSDPSVTDVDTEDVAKTTAKVVVTIANPQSTSQTVHMRYKKTADANWNPARTLSTMGTEVTFNLSGLSGGTEYQAQASLDSTFAMGVVSRTFTTLNEPGAPKNFDITEKDKELFAGWDAPTDTGGTAITGYKVQWKSGSQGFNASRQNLEGSLATSSTISSLQNGTEYTVRVRATNSVGNGAWSVEEQGTPSTTPGKPVVTIAQGNTELTVSWTIDTGGSAITGHTLQYKLASVAGWAGADVTEVDKAADQTSHTITGLTNGTSYTVRVKATNANGTGAWSDEATVAPVAGPSVTDVETEDLAKTTAKVVVTIANPQSTSETVSMRYKKTADANWNPAQTLSTSGTEVKFPLTGLIGGTEYQAQASLDGTFATGVVSHTFTTLDVAGKPTGVTVTKDDKKLTVAWTAPTDTGGTAITGFKVQWKSGNQSFGGDPLRQHTAGAADTSYGITGLTNGREYTVRVRATNSVGDGAWSVEEKGTPSTTPGKPVVNVSAGNGLLQVRWTVDDGGAAIDQHTVQWKSGSQNFDSSRQHTTAAKQYTIPSLTNHTEYDVRVRAHNDNGDGAWSDVKSETPTPKPPPSVTIATEESEPIQGPFTFTVTFNEEVEDFHCYEDEPENPPDGPLCEIGAGYVGGALVDVKDFQEVGVNPAGEHVFSARVEDILTGTLAIFVNEGKAHAEAGGLGNTFGALQVEVELLDSGARPPSTPVWSSQMTPASIGGYLGYGSVGSQTGGSLTNDEFNWQGQTYTVKALLYNPAQGQLELDLSPALPDQGHRMVLEFYYVDTQQRYHASLADPRESVVIQDDEQLWTYHWHPAETELEAGGLVVVKLERQGPGGPPPPPTGLSATPVPNAIALSWDGPPSGVSVTGYRVERRNRKGGEYAVVIDDTGSAGAGYTDSTATSDGKYYYRVTALNSAGESWPSYPVSAGPPGQPQSASALGTREDASLSWDDPQDDSITGYRIERRDRDQGGGFSPLVSDTGGSDTGYSDDTVEPGGRYAYRVTALNDYGESDPSDPVEVDIPGGPPDRPRGLSATATEDAVTLSWDDPQDDGITGYRIERQDRDGGDGFATLVADTGSADTGYTDGTVEAGGSYAYRVSAINDDGESPPSAAANVDVPGGQAPAKPTGLGATASEDAVTLSWDDPGDDGITGYRIWRRNRDADPAGQFSVLVDDTHSDATMFTDRGVKPDTRYAYRIAAINDAGESQWSGFARVRTPPAPVHRDG